MSTSEIESTTRKVISRQSTQQLQSKIEKGTLLGLSKQIALDILKKRGVEIKNEEIIEIEKPVISSKKQVKVDIVEKTTNEILKEKKSLKNLVINLLTLSKTKVEIVEELIKQGFKENSIIWNYYEFRNNNLSK